MMSNDYDVTTVMQQDCRCAPIYHVDVQLVSEDKSRTNNYEHDTSRYV